jgi:hypothetical protein
MEISRGAAAIVAAGCLTVGAAGAYFVSSGRGTAPVTAPAETAAPLADPASELATTVEQSEEVIADTPVDSGAAERPTPRASARSTAPAAPRATSRRVESRSANAPAASGDRAPQSTSGRPVRVDPVEEPSVPPAPREEQRVAAPPALEPIRQPEPEITRAPEPPAPQFEELVVSADSVLGLEVETSLSSERARVEDAVVARVSRDVKVGDRVAIPAGSKVNGEVTLVERGGKLRERARLGIRFTSVVLADGTRLPLETNTIYREGDAPGGESAAKIGGGAIGGAILGGILGGAKGAAIGGAVGAGAGTGAVMAGGRNPATLPSGTPVTVRITKPATVTVEK